jgi:hypothetical protein
VARLTPLTALAVIFAFTAQVSNVSTAFAGSETNTTPTANPDAVKSAYESAKELGTADAWNAFLGSYPTGFYADMARAYLKKVGEPAAATTAPPAAVTTAPPVATPTPSNPEPPVVVTAPTPSSGRAGERSCSERNALRSEHSREPTKITFVNQSGMYRAIMWIDFDGTLKDYGGLNSGEELSLDTFRTHPWMIATGPGDCLQIFLPAAEPATVHLERLAADDAPIRAAPVAQTTKAEKKKAPPPQKLKCAQNYKLKNGECVLIQNCGKNAYRTAEGDCFCKKGYVMRKGKCQWPQDKNGFEVAPWKKGGCSSLQAQCSQGNGGACMKYEEKCQVN